MSSIVSEFDYDELIEAKRRQLELKTFAATVGLGSTAVNSMRVDRTEDFLTQDAIRRISMEILTDKIADDTYTATYTHKVFASWWQHFKWEYFPKWLLEKFPVKYTGENGNVYVKLERLALYPKANINIDHGSPVFIRTLGGHEVIKDTVSQIK